VLLLVTDEAMNGKVNGYCKSAYQLVGWSVCLSVSHLFDSSVGPSVGLPGQ